MGRIAMDGMQRLPPRRPAFPRKNAGLDPFREFRRAFQGLSRELPQAVVGEAFGQAVDRLPLGNVACLFGRQDIVRMNDLEFLAIGFQLAGDEALFMERQQLTRPARVPAEINQRGIIALSNPRMDAERRTSAAARVVIDGRKLKDRKSAEWGKSVAVRVD